MPQVIQNANLGVVKFPLLSSLVGRTPMSDSRVQAGATGSSTDSSKSFSQPSLLYGENVLPTNWGYTSINYDVPAPKYLRGAGGVGQGALIESDIANNLTEVITRELVPVKAVDGSVGICYLVLGKMGSVDQWIYSIRLYSFSQSTIPGKQDFWDSLGTTTVLTIAKTEQVLYNISYAEANSATYICVNFTAETKASSYIFRFTSIKSQAAAITTINFVDNYPSKTAATAAEIKNCVRAITSSQGQLILADQQQVYWSAVANPLDFKPDVVTGAGSGVPIGLQGTIVTLGSLANGFAVYSTGAIVKARATGNAGFPYTFYQSQISSGISSSRDVAIAQENYVNTSEGVVSISIAKDSAINSELTDFLASKIFEYWDINTDTRYTEQLVDRLDTRLTAIQDRYFIVSYKRKSDNYFYYAIIYDIVLNKFGKIAYPHYAITTFNFDTEGELKSYEDLNQAGTVNEYNYDLFNPSSFNSLRDGVRSFNARGNRIIALLGVDSELALVNPSYGVKSFNSYLVLGKFSTSKSNTSTLHSISVDGVYPDTLVTVLPTLDGSMHTEASHQYVAPYPLAAKADGVTGSYYGRKSAKGFLIALTGSFHATYLEAVLEVQGRR